MGRKTPAPVVGEDLRLVRDPNAEEPELRAVFEKLAAADDAAVARLYDPERETYFTA